MHTAAALSTTLDPAVPTDEEDVCDLWKVVFLETAPRELLTQARRLMAALPDDERRKNLCGVLLADYLDPEYCPVPFFQQEKEPAPEEVERALLDVQLHQYALETWHGLLAKERDY